VAGVHVAHRLAVRRGLELVQNPDNEPVELVFVDVKALGDLFRRQPVRDMAKEPLAQRR